MIQPGDTVRYLNAVGGGKVVRVDGKIAYVDDDGFETPVQVSELVVVLPAGHVSDKPGKKMFDQEAFDAGKSNVRPKIEERRTERGDKPGSISSLISPISSLPIEETAYGDDMTLLLAFEPDNVKKLDTTDFGAVLVNDSNYFLSYLLLRRDEAGTGWTVESRGEAAPNELVDLARYTHADLHRIERIVFQAIAWKDGKSFEFKTPISVSRKIDLTKFFKLHCFRPGVYFDTPVLEVPLIAEVPRNLKSKG